MILSRKDGLTECGALRVAGRCGDAFFCFLCNIEKINGWPASILSSSFGFCLYVSPELWTTSIERVRF